MRSLVPAFKQENNTGALLQRKPNLRIGEKDDRYEQEADRTADAVLGGRSTAPLATINIMTPLQRDNGAKPKSEEEKYKQAAKKLGEAFLETGPGKQIKSKAEKLGDAFISTLPGKIITGSAITGAVAALAATHKELPIDIPEIPLDKIKPGLKLKLTYEGPVDNPTKVMATFSIPLGPLKVADKKPAMSKSERYRAETARMAMEQQQFRESMKTPKQRAKERQQEQDMINAWVLSQQLPGSALNFGTAGVNLSSPLGNYAPDFTISGEQPKTEEPKKKKEDETAVQRKSVTTMHDSSAPAIVNEVLESSGQPLEPNTRSVMESRFGYDFSQVRIHTDGKANKSADAINALAFTAGQHIVFGAANFAPDTHQGRHLLAHELTHVVQQTQPMANGKMIRRKNKAKAAVSDKFYQYVIHMIESMNKEMDEDRRLGHFVFEPSRYQGLKALQALSQAVEQENIAEIPKLLDAYMKADTFFHLGTLTRGLMIELATRMFKLGLESASLKLRSFYQKNARFAPGYDPGAQRRNVKFYTRLVDSALSSADSSTAENAATSLELMIRSFVPLRNALAEVDQSLVAHERRYPPQFQLRPWMSSVEFNDALIEQVETLFSGIETMFQALIDFSSAELEQGQGATTLKLTKTLLETKLRPALFPDEKSKSIAGLKIQITHTSDIKKGRGKISDEFAQGKAKQKRSVAVSTYDPEQAFAEELSMSLEKLFYVRRNQVEVLARIYGATELIPISKDKQGVLSDDAQRNAEAIKKLEGGRLRLHNDDDWRAFVLQKYQDMVKPTSGRLKKSPSVALKAIIELLFAYLGAFTIHARYTNIYDIGDNYLNREFPRALSGQLIQDCGVYALRVAYILSLVRAELKLRFRFVVLPAHVALVIDGDQVPAYIVHNNHYEELSPEEWAGLRKYWDKFKEQKEVVDPSDPSGLGTTTKEEKAPGPSDETQFVGELAGSTYITGPVDMPFIVSKVPQAGDSAKAAQARLWAFYQRTATKELFGPASKQKKSEGYLFHTRYLALTERMRQIHNEVLVKAWNVDAPATWKSFNKLLTGDGKRSTISSSELLGLLLGHEANYDKALEPVNVRYESVQRQKITMSQQLRNDQKLRRKGVRLGYGPRAATLWTYYWVAYRTRLARFISELEAMTETQIPLQKVRDRLAPPFMPTDEKKIYPLD